jgi:hypothetical protein
MVIPVATDAEDTGATISWKVQRGGEGATSSQSDDTCEVAPQPASKEAAQQAFTQAYRAGERGAFDEAVRCSS